MAEARDAGLIAETIVAAAASVSANAACAGLIAKAVIVALAGGFAKALVADLIAEASAVVGACAFFGTAMGEEEVEGKKKATGSQRKKSSFEKGQHQKILLGG